MSAILWIIVCAFGLVCALFAAITAHAMWLTGKVLRDMPRPHYMPLPEPPK